MVTTTIGARIREFRMKKGMTQVELSNGICTPSMISQIEADRARPSYRVLAAIAERLDVAMEYLLKDLHLEMEVTSKYKMAMGMVCAGQYLSAIPLLEEVREQANGQVSWMDLMMELGVCYLETGQGKQATEIFQEVQEAALLGKDQERLIRVLMLLGDAAMREKECTLALFHTSRALEASGEMGEGMRSVRLSLVTQMAAIYQKMGKAEEAVRYYLEAAALCDDGEDLEKKGKLYLHAALTAHRQKRYELAEEYATKASVLLGEVKEQEQAMEWKRQLILLRRDSQDDSVQQLLEMAKWYEKRNDLVKAGERYADLAALCFESEQDEATGSYAEKARLMLPHDHPAVGKVYRVMGMVQFGRGELEKGRKYLQQAMTIFQTHDLLAEMEEVALKLAGVLEQKGEYQEALRMLSGFHVTMVGKLQERGIAL
ncbi:tetratricopeptide repeat protein [Tumebacillus sp. BK434]|uniref:helix-turn-helix domain-containing protein n=1 Tax=Tumebacillus sp. BK434 TaxID=2512169 RepID=UPI0010494D09|nr:tetratricopeptide repeat protein [Tumebacillus sp. BK434]TCP58275.1 tetratricopeptide repeat protein [Tumebacillus sp. BK434]